MSTDNTVTNVAAGKPRIVGGVYMAPAGTALPTDAATALASAYKPLGYVSSDGVKNNNTLSGKEVRAWGGDIIYVGSEGRTDEWKMKLMEVLNENVLKLVAGDDNVTGSIATALSVAINNADLPTHVFVIDMILRGTLKRVVIPVGKLKDISEITYADSDPVGYEVTVSALTDSSGNSHYEYFGVQSST